MEEMWCLGLLLLLLARIESLHCPERCHCVQTTNSNSNVTFQVTCVNLRDVPNLLRILPNPTTQLIVKDAEFSSLTELQQILPKTSQLLPKLTDFSITDSKVRNQGEETTAIKEFLPFASIRNPVPRGSGFTQLQILNLSNNTLTHLPPSFFHSCSCLQTLDLSDNLIKNFETEIFYPLVNLLRLDLRRNRLRSLNEPIFRNLSKLLTLDVSHNEIARLDPTTFQNLASLNTLILAGNPLSSGLVLLGAGRRLQVVDASDTGLGQAPTSLERTVRTLQLSGNLLTAIRCGDLDSYSLLSSLNLNSNRISYVEEDAMGRMELLAELHLSHNKLFHVPRSLPDNLEVLDLSYNLIQNISNADFLNLSALKELSISNNQIHFIEESVFASLASLRILDLSRNPVLVLPPLTGLKQLQVLNLSYLTNASRAWRFSLRTFPLPNPGSIEVLRLEASPALSNVFLTDTGTLQRFANLSELHLRFSNLTLMRKDIFTLLPALNSLQLEGNPWHCDREMLVTADWLRTHGATGPEDGDTVNTMHCATPVRLHGKPLVALSPGDFKEDPEKIYEIEKLNTLEIFKNQSSFKGVKGNPSGARIYLKSYENSIESVDNGRQEKIEKTSNALEGLPPSHGDNDSRLNVTLSTPRDGVSDSPTGITTVSAPINDSARTVNETKMSGDRTSLVLLKPPFSNLG